MRLYVWRHRSAPHPWIVTSVPRTLYTAGVGEMLSDPYWTHAEAFADAWARTHPKEETPC